MDGLYAASLPSSRLLFRSGLSSRCVYALPLVAARAYAVQHLTWYTDVRTNLINGLDTQRSAEETAAPDRSPSPDGAHIQHHLLSRVFLLGMLQ